MSDPSAGHRPLRILVADDEPLILRLLKRTLERRGHEVQTAEDAHAALALIGAASFDVALVDARMPGDGLTVVRTLTESPEFSGRVVLMTGGLAADAGEDVDPDVHRLQKPFSFPDVIPLVEGHRV